MFDWLSDVGDWFGGLFDSGSAVADAAATADDIANFADVGNTVGNITNAATSGGGDWLSWLGNNAGTILKGGGTVAQILAANQANNQANDYRNSILSMAQNNQSVQSLLANRMLDAQLANYIGPEGEQVFYDEPSRTWVTLPSDAQKGIINARNQEILNGLTHDAWLNRTNNAYLANRMRTEDARDDWVFQQDYDRYARGANRDEALQATQNAGVARDRQLAQKYADPTMVSREGISGLLAQRAVSGLNRGYDEESANINRQMARTGTSAAPILAALAERRSEAYKNALMDAEIQGTTLSENINNNRTSTARNAYSMLTRDPVYSSAIRSGAPNTSRSGSMNPSGFAMPDVAGSLSATQQGRASGLNSAFGNAANISYNSNVPLMNAMGQFAKPDYTSANTMGAWGNLASGIVDTLAGRRTDSNKTLGKDK